MHNKSLQDAVHYEGAYSLLKYCKMLLCHYGMYLTVNIRRYIGWKCAVERLVWIYVAERLHKCAFVGLRTNGKLP